MTLLLSFHQSAAGVHLLCFLFDLWTVVEGAQTLQGAHVCFKQIMMMVMTDVLVWGQRHKKVYFSSPTMENILMLFRLEVGAGYFRRGVMVDGEGATRHRVVTHAKY